MTTLLVIALIAYALLFIVFAWAMKEVHFIHGVKKCKHLCYLCEYANVCLDGGCAYVDTDSVQINNTNTEEQQVFLFVKRNKNQ